MSFDGSYIDKALLQQVAEGNEKAFRELFDRYWDHIYGVALAFTKSPVMAEEIVQDIFLKIWLKRQQLAAVERPDAYLFMIARNHIFNEIRKKLKEKQFTDHISDYFQQVSESPEQQLLFKESQQLINAAVEHLPAQQRMIYLLTRHQGLSQEEIALQLHISRHTVKSHMHKALRSIRSYLQANASGEVTFFIYLAFLLL